MALKSDKKLVLGQIEALQTVAESGPEYSGRTATPGLSYYGY